MVKKNLVLMVSIILLITFSIILNSCETGVEDSPQPGIVKVTFQSNPSDTMLVERSDTFVVNTKYDAIFAMKIFQGRIYQDTNFAILFNTTESYRQEDIVRNLIAKDSLGNYLQYTIFESYVPPGEYDKLEFGVTPGDVPLVIVSLSGKTFANPVELPPGEKLLVSFPVNFTVNENQTTQIDVQIYPFESIERYRDVYRFYRQMEVTNVKNL